MTVLTPSHFEKVCEEKFVEWYNEQVGSDRYNIENYITTDNVKINWLCQILRNYRLVATSNDAFDTIYMEFIYDGWNKIIYQNVYNQLDSIKIE